MSPVLLGADHLHPSQPFSLLSQAELSQASSCRLLCQVIDMQQRVCWEELMPATHTGYIPTKAWQHAGLSCPPSPFTAKEQNDVSPIHHPSAPWRTSQPFYYHTTFYLQFSSPKLEEKKKPVSIPRSDTLISQQLNSFKIISFNIMTQS